MANIRPDQRMKCPHCLTVVRFEYVSLDNRRDSWGKVGPVYVDAPIQEGKETEKIILTIAACPECGGLILTIEPTKQDKDQPEPNKEHIVWPLSSSRPVPHEVPEHIRNNYQEASLVLNFSPKASAALSRRCLQTILREAGNAQQHNLSDQIEAVIPNLPPYIAESIDDIRNIGNFAAHPIKSTSSGEIIEVEPGEAEWNLDVLDMLFEFYYVKPAHAKTKRQAIDEKLKSAGKSPMMGKS